MEDLVSIIITINNDEKTLKDCIYSVISQTYRNIELIIIDDGSTDDSAKICNDLLISNSKLKLFKQLQSGLSTSRNKGLELASGKYVTFINGSDIMSNKLIENLVSMMNNYEVDIASCKTTYSPNLDNNESSQVITFDTEDCLRQLLIGKTLTNTPYGKLFKKSLFNTIKFQDNEADTIYRLFEESDKTAFLNVNEYYQTEFEDFSLPTILNKDLRIIKKYPDLSIYCKYNIVKSIQYEFYNSLTNNLPIIDEDKLYSMFKKIILENENDIIPFFDYKKKAHLYILANDLNNYKIVCPVLPEIDKN